jgi:hypothetical protein
LSRKRSIFGIMEEIQRLLASEPETTAQQVRCKMIIVKGSELTRLTVEFGSKPEPAETERRRSQMERAQRNGAWLQSHWAELLPHARGKFVAVAGEEGFIADTAEQAWEWTRQAHPEDDGCMVQFVPIDTNPRIYANRR